MGIGKRVRQADLSPKTTVVHSEIVESKADSDFTLEYIEETFIEREKEKIKLKVKEKLTLCLQHEKDREVNQLGQIYV